MSCTPPSPNHSPNHSPIRSPLPLSLGRLVALVLAAVVVTPGQPVDAQGASDPAAERLMMEARRHIERGDIDAALAELGALVQRLPDTRQAPEALLMSLRLQLRAGRTGDARATSERLISKYPQSGEAASAAVLQARSRIEQAVSPADLEQARTELRRVPNLYGSEAFPTLVARSEARVLSAYCSMNLGDLEAAAADLVVVIEDEPPSPFTDRARLDFARVLLLEGDWQASADLLQRIIESSNEQDDPMVVDRARRLLGLVYRLLVRPAAGLAPWQRTSAVTPTGVQWKKPVAVAAGDGSRQAVCDQGLGTCLVIDGSDVLARLDVRRPQRVTFEGSGRFSSARRAWVVASDGMAALDRSASLVRLEATGKSRPLSKIEAASTGALNLWFVVDRDVDGIAVVDSSGRSLGSAGTGQVIKPIDIATDPQGSVWVLDEQNGVVRLGIDRRAQSSFRVSAKKPRAITVDALANVYVLDGANGAISVYDKRGRNIHNLGPTFPGGVSLRSPEDIAVDAAGRLFVVDSRDARMVMIE